MRVGEPLMIKLRERGGVAFERSLLPGIHRGEHLVFGGAGGEGGREQQQNRKGGFHCRKSPTFVRAPGSSIWTGDEPIRHAALASLCILPLASALGAQDPAARLQPFF